MQNSPDPAARTVSTRRRVPDVTTTLEPFLRQKNLNMGFQLAAVRLRQSSVERKFLLKRSEEHTSELQSLAYLVCRLLLEKKKKKMISTSTTHKKVIHPPVRCARRPVR